MGTIKYDIYENPGRNNGQKRYHVRAAKPNLTTYKEIQENLSHASSITPSDISGVTEGISDLMANKLSNGNRIHIKGLGYFSVTITSPTFDNPKEINATKVQIRTIEFQPDAELMDKIKKNLTFERAQANEHSRLLLESEIKNLLKDYFKKHDDISLREFRMLTHLTRATAYRRLKELCDGPIPYLKHMGPRNASVYVLAQGCEW